MTDAPERISISPVCRQKREDDYYLVDRGAYPGKGIEYVRADLVQGQIEKALRYAALDFLVSEGEHCEAIAAAVAAEREACAVLVDRLAATVKADADSCRERHPQFAQERDEYSEDISEIAAAIRARSEA